MEQELAQGVALISGIVLVVVILVLLAGFIKDSRVVKRWFCTEEPKPTPKHGVCYHCGVWMDPKRMSKRRQMGSDNPLLFCPAHTPKWDIILPGWGGGPPTYYRHIHCDVEGTPYGYKKASE